MTKLGGSRAYYTTQKIMKLKLLRLLLVATETS